MRLIIFAGTPGSGKTSVIKYVIEELIRDFSIHYVKFDVLVTDDDVLIKKKFHISTEKKLAGDLCPDHYSALEIPKIIEKHKNKDLIIVETAGLCLRCSPYLDKGLGVVVANITAGKPASYGPILTEADLVAINKGDLISQAEREIFRIKLLEVNTYANIVETNGLTGEGSMDLVEFMKKMPPTKGQLTLKKSMPSAICGYCYGNKTINDEAANVRYKKGSELKSLLPNKNCGACGYKSCNEFIRAVLDGLVEKEKCIYLNVKEK
jgi:Ni2+-binding GTPase involved in maturation of urease and hydrogenase